jgi:hypothetical protein
MLFRNLSICSLPRRAAIIQNSGCFAHRHIQSRELAPHGHEVPHEGIIFLLPLKGIGNPKNRRGMYGRGHRLGAGVVDERASLLKHAVILADDRSRRSRTQTDDDPRLNDSDLRLDPWMTSHCFDNRRFLMNATFASLLELEMFDGIGDVDIFARDASISQRPIKHFARRTYEQLAHQILAIAGLLPTSITCADAGPSPMTARVAHLYRSQPLQRCAASPSCSSVASAGTYGAAVGKVRRVTETYRSYKRRNSALASFSTFLRPADSVFPARLM